MPVFELLVPTISWVKLNFAILYGLAPQSRCLFGDALMFNLED